MDNVLGRFGARFSISLEREGNGLKLTFNTKNDSDAKRLADLYDKHEVLFFDEMDIMMGECLDHWTGYTRRPSWN